MSLSRSQQAAIVRNVVTGLPKGSRFTTDTVLAYLPDDGKERRWLGPLITELAERGLIAMTGIYKKSEHSRCHSRPKLVWRRR